ncbi:MAG: TetR/AcrR family transcriptional regulator [Desulfobacula sp.]|nr:TetR/AcrR family transcriptional regulator [Desulfobacula sp.]
MDNNTPIKKKILKTAAKIFAEYGFEGARMDQIAKAADVNKASIYYNIGNKKALYEKVLVETIRPALNEFTIKLKHIQEPKKKLKAYINNIGKALIDNPHISKIIMREQASKGKNLPELFAVNIAEVLNTLDSILQQGKDEQIFEEVDTLTIHFMILATLMFQISSAPIRKEKKAFPKKYHPRQDEDFSHVIENITKYILKAVCKGE